jgi:hypothetical protein
MVRGYLYSSDNKSMTKLMINGLTTKSVEKLVPLAKYWSYPPVIKTIASGGFTIDGFDPAEMAYHITCLEIEQPHELNFEVEASAASPLVNPCFVLKNWGNSEPVVKQDDLLLHKNKNLRIGYRISQVGNDLLVWVETESSIPVKFSISSR